MYSKMTAASDWPRLFLHPRCFCLAYIYTHTHAHTSIYIHVHTRIAVHVYITFCLLMEGGMVRVYRILRVMPQPPINIPKICFVTNYGKLRNCNFLNNNILYHLLGGIYGPQKDEHQDARISPQATTSVAIKYGLYILLLLPC